MTTLENKECLLKSRFNHAFTVSFNTHAHTHTIFYISFLTTFKNFTGFCRILLLLVENNCSNCNWSSGGRIQSSSVRLAGSPFHWVGASSFSATAKATKKYMFKIRSTCLNREKESLIIDILNVRISEKIIKGYQNGKTVSMWLWVR